MALFEWQPRFSVGIPELDQQHQRLVALINELHEAMMKGKGSAVQQKILAELVRYTQTHFDAEEAFMRSLQYPAFPEHRLNHEKMTREVRTLQQNLVAGNEILSIDLMTFLRDWLQNHILKEDSQYAAYARQRHTAAAAQ